MGCSSGCSDGETSPWEPVPVSGTKEHFLEALTKGKADAVLAASLFHYKELEIRELKRYLREHKVPVRI